MKKIFDLILWVVFYVLTIVLIEYHGEDFLLDVAGNVFGSLFLIGVGVFLLEKARDE